MSDKKTGTLRNYDIMANTPDNVTSALDDILAQRISAALGMKIRRIHRALKRQGEDLNAERERMAAHYAEASDDEKAAMDAEWNALMQEEFACELIPFADVEKLNLKGWTFTSPIIEAEE